MFFSQRTFQYIFLLCFTRTDYRFLFSKFFSGFVFTYKTRDLRYRTVSNALLSAFSVLVVYLDIKTKTKTTDCNGRLLSPKGYDQLLNRQYGEILCKSIAKNVIPGSSRHRCTFIYNANTPSVRVILNPHNDPVITNN